MTTQLNLAFPKRKDQNMARRLKSLPKKTHFKDVASLQNYLDSIPDINAGGCGIAAYFIYKQLKQDGKNPEIVFMYQPGNPSYEQNLAALKGQDHPTSAAHVMVKADGKYYDAEGVNDDGWYGLRLRHTASEKFLLQAIADRGGWNSMFERDEWLPEIEKKVGINLPML